MVVILFRLNNVAYDIFELYYYEETDTNHYPSHQPR